MTTEGRFCPTCGTKRTGFFRWCSKCGFDFDELIKAAPDSASIVPGQVALPPAPAAPAPAAPVSPAPVSPAPEPSVFEVVTTVRPEVVTPQRPRSRERIFVRVAIVALAGVLALSAISNALGPRSGSSAQPSTAIGSPLVGESAAAGVASGSPAAPTFGPTSETQYAIVNSVTDGDTIRVDVDGEEYPLRYIGIDAPEPDASDPTIKGWADAATAANRALIEGKEVYLERDVSDTDQFDRLLRHVWFVGPDGDWVLANLELVQRGFAEAKTFPPDDKYASLLMQAQESAKTASIGLWAPAASPSVGSSPAAVESTPLTLVGGGGGGSDCHASYTPCLPIVGDLDCAEVRSMGAAPVSVKGSDEYALDRDGDGIGCE
jgi:micrococcal nuclease